MSLLDVILLEFVSWNRKQIMFIVIMCVFQTCPQFYLIVLTLFIYLGFFCLVTCIYEIIRTNTTTQGMVWRVICTGLCMLQYIFFFLGGGGGLGVNRFISDLVYL